MARQFVKYNPAFLDTGKLVENFVVRETDLQMIARTVRDNMAASNQHVLVIGPRGSGKTTLVRRVSAEIRRDEALDKAWYPLVFAEESYNALTAADFWLESIFHLAEQTGDGRWMASHDDLRRDPDEKRLAQRALGKLLDFADSIGKRILLIVENLDMLLSEFSDETDAWALRHTLMNEPRLMLLATATGRFEQIDHPAKAMFEMFRIHELKPLDDEECNRIWALVTGEPLPGEQIRPIRILTGGNARLIAIIARFGANRSFSELLEELVDLIDEHTDYIKSHLDNMAPKERKVYLALAELWSVATAKEIADMARMDVNATSALLNRLASRGKVVAEGKSKKDRRYRLAEGIYNLYYLMRRRGGPSGRVTAAVRFMVVLYEPVAAAKLLLKESLILQPFECNDHMRAIEEVYHFATKFERYLIAQSVPLSILESNYFDAQIVDEMRILQDLGKMTDAETVVRRSEVKKQFDIASRLYGESRYYESIEQFHRIVKEFNEFNDDLITTYVVLAMVYEGRLLGEQGQLVDAINVFQELERKYGERSEGLIAPAVAWGMTRKGSILAELFRFEEAVDVLKAVERKYEKCKEMMIREQVAWAMLFKGNVLTKMSLLDDAIVAYENVSQKYSGCSNEEICDVFLIAQATKIKVLLQIGRFSDALNEMSGFIRQYHQSENLIDEVVGLYIDLAAYGYSEDALKLLFASSTEENFEPLVVALKLFLGQETNAPTEILEVAKDVVKLIEARKRELDAGKA